LFFCKSNEMSVPPLLLHGLLFLCKSNEMSVPPHLLHFYVSYFLFIRLLCVSDFQFSYFISTIFLFGFYCPSLFSPSFSPLFCLCFSTPVSFISSLPSLTCLGLNRLVVVVCKSNDVASCSYFRYNKAPFDIAPAPDSAPVTESDSL
jgi:hypothetical protein